jgi:hypothetical protein
MNIPGGYPGVPQQLALRRRDLQYAQVLMDDVAAGSCGFIRLATTHADLYASLMLYAFS